MQLIVSLPSRPLQAATNSGEERLLLLQKQRVGGMYQDLGPRCDGRAIRVGL